MGGDGGTSVSRDLIVQNIKRRGLVEDIRITNHAKYTNCALSGLPIRAPLLIDELGLIYNKDSVLQYLLDVVKFKEILKSGTNTAETAQEEHSRYVLEEKMNQFAHLQRLSDLFSCTVTMFSDIQNKKNKNNTVTSSASASSANNTNTANSTIQDLSDYIMCPILDVKADGLLPFIVMRDCQCVMSMKGYEQIHGDLQTVAITVNDDLQNKSALNATSLVEKTVRACCLCLKPLAARYQPDYKPITTEELQQQRPGIKLTETDKMTTFSLQNHETPYIPLIPSSDHDKEMLEQMMIKKREHLGRPTPEQIRNQLKKQKLLRSRQLGNIDQLVQLAPIGK